MIKNSNKSKKCFAKLSTREIQNIKYYIKGAVYSFCNNCKSNDGDNCWFAAYNLFGEENYYWQEPLIMLYNYYINIGKPQSEAIIFAGKDIGILLKQVLIEDTRVYEQNSMQRKFLVNSYKLLHI